ncbi:hypothetical protein PVK06_043155 [Gossypium arboreum]|uniref:Putative plant transposon protein domain-containing protein n=1 Tax=Gossypium arboreum TaxID=29729 RepID=A0ABR0MN54_GOSAR|nr:hypothetical protein PVK06_043155 [Gossypium arboreum]
MSRKRTKSSKTTLENPIVIHKKVKERFDSIFMHQPMMPEKGFNLKSNDLMVVPVPIKKTINALKWERFCDACSLPDDKLVREFYASLTTQDATAVIVRKKKVHLTFKSINDLFNLPDVGEDDEYYPMMNNINWDFLQQVLDVVTNPRSQWIIRKYGSHSCRREYLKPIAKFHHLDGTNALVICHLDKKSINVGKIILKEIYDCSKKKRGSAYFPSLINSLYLRACVKTKMNLKG